MTIFYLDNAATFKRYRPESGTATVDQLLGNPAPDDRFFTSFLSVLEFTAALMRLVKGRLLPEDVAREILASFTEDCTSLFNLWSLNNTIADAAVDITLAHKLRAGDAIHLATAVAVFSAFPSTEPVLVSSDRELLAAATASGITVLDPQDPEAPARLTALRAARR